MALHEGIDLDAAEVTALQVDAALNLSFTKVSLLELGRIFWLVEERTRLRHSTTPLAARLAATVLSAGELKEMPRREKATHHQGVIGRRDQLTGIGDRLADSQPAPNGHSLGFVEGVKFRREAE